MSLLFARFYLEPQKKKLKFYNRDFFKINGKEAIEMPRNGKSIKFKNYGRKIKSPFMIYADFESTLVPEDNGKQNRNESYTNKYQKHFASSNGYKLAFLNDTFSKPFY